MWHNGQRSDHAKEEAVCEFSSQDWGQQRVVTQVVEASEISKTAEPFFDFPEPQMTEQLVNVPEILIDSFEAEPFATTHTGAQNLGNAASAKNEELLAGLKDCDGGAAGWLRDSVRSADCRWVRIALGSERK